MASCTTIVATTTTRVRRFVRGALMAARITAHGSSQSYRMRNTHLTEPQRVICLADATIEDAPPSRDAFLFFIKTKTYRRKFGAPSQAEKDIWIVRRAFDRDDGVAPLLTNAPNYRLSFCSGRSLDIREPRATLRLTRSDHCAEEYVLDG